MHERLWAALARSFEQNATRPALVESSEAQVVHYGELRDRVDEMADRLTALGVQPGEVVPLFAARTPAAVVLALAAVKIGAAFCFLYTKHAIPELIRIVQVMRARALLVDSSSAPALAGATAEQLAALRVRRVAPADDSTVEWPGHLAATPFLSDGPASSAGEPAAENAVTVLFTSGLTGQSKGVLIGSDDLLARATTEIACFELASNDVLLAILPLAFDVGLNQLFSSLLTGSYLCFTSMWMRSDLNRVVRDYGVTGISANPGLWLSCLRRLPDGERLFEGSPLRYVTVSGGSLAPAMFQRLSAALGERVMIHRTYGQSETFRSAIFLAANAREHAGRSSSVGVAVPGTRVYIARDKEQLAAVGERGELLHVGDGTMLGYLGDVALTDTKLGTHAALGSTPVVYTGDHAHLDAEGFIHLAGRADGMMKVLGLRFYPSAVEAVLARDPSVLEAVVFGVPHAIAGERVVAVVTEQSPIDTAQLLARVADQLPPYMTPTEIEVWPSFPRTDNGKPALAEIKRRYLAAAGDGMRSE